MEFNEDQIIVNNGMEKWVPDFREPYLILSGVSGSGKSTCVGNFLEKINGKKICITAPTTEALESLVETIQGQGVKTEYSAKTIQSLLGYRPVTGQGDEQILVRAGGRRNEDGTYTNPPPKVVPYDYVILEEGYFCPSILIDSIFENYSSIKWLILGDHKQLPPVKESVSALLSKESETQYFFDLKTDMRSIDPEQTALVAKVRMNGAATPMSKYTISKKEAYKSIQNLWMECNQCPEDFSFLALAYTHKVVDKLAIDMRDLIYDRGPEERYQKGELIRVSSVIASDGDDNDSSQEETLTRTNERVRVIQHELDFIIVERNFGEIVKLPIDHENELETMRLNALKSGDRDMMRIYHNMKRKYVNISSLWAMTVHSSQGRTKKNTLLCWKNILSAQSHNLAYVAVGRSRNLPWVVDEW